MRRLAGMFAVLLVLAGMSLPAEAGRSGFRSAGHHAFAGFSVHPFAGSSVHPFTSGRIVFGNAVASRFFVLTPTPILFNPGTVPQFTGGMGRLVPHVGLGTTNPNILAITAFFFSAFTVFLVSPNASLCAVSATAFADRSFALTPSPILFNPGPVPQFTG